MTRNEELTDRIEEQKRYIKVLEDQNEDLKKRLAEAEEEVAQFAQANEYMKAETMEKMYEDQYENKPVKQKSYKSVAGTCKPTKSADPLEDALIDALNDVDEPSAMKSRWA